MWPSDMAYFGDILVVETPRMGASEYCIIHVLMDGEVHYKNEGIRMQTIDPKKRDDLSGIVHVEKTAAFNTGEWYLE